MDGEEGEKIDKEVDGEEKEELELLVFVDGNFSSLIVSANEISLSLASWMNPPFDEQLMKTVRCCATGRCSTLDGINVT